MDIDMRIKSERLFQTKFFLFWIFTTVSSFQKATRLSRADKEAVDTLVKQWAPLVWLAPGEKFMPLDVNEFLYHVHPEDNNSKQKNTEFNNLNDNYQNDEVQSNSNQEWIDNEISQFQRRTFINLPLGEASEKSYLVTNNDIDDLLNDSNSFVYGKNPSKLAIPIYAVVKICNVAKDIPKSDLNEQKYERVPFIPVTPSENEPLKSTIINGTKAKIPVPVLRSKRSIPTVQIQQVVNKSNNDNNENINEISKQTNEFMANIVDNVKFTIDPNDHFSIKTNELKNAKRNLPHFHVTYWMFYPYSQGKALCTFNLGPLGRVPIPLFFGMCFGSRKDIGSHIGDWEHMSLVFAGASEPEYMYVSAHDAGAYYSYNRLTGTFEFKSQETRKGILQRPNFPKTVITSYNHPVLFAAKGSHGLWTAPGKHRFVRVPRLYDINGFGTPWYTWKAVEITYENLRLQRSITPDWLQFKGKWGNPKSKCHPFRRIGINFCEYADGPTGIPLKQAHFFCDTLI